MEWTKEWPGKEGLYWFYGYRYGKISCGEIQNKELCLVKVVKISNGFMYTADGNFMYKSKVEDTLFKKAILPKLPN